MGKQRRHGQHMYFPKIINIKKTSIKLDNFIEKCVFLYLVVFMIKNIYVAGQVPDLVTKATAFATWHGDNWATFGVKTISANQQWPPTPTLFLFKDIIYYNRFPNELVNLINAHGEIWAQSSSGAYDVELTIDGIIFEYNRMTNNAEIQATGFLTKLAELSAINLRIVLPAYHSSYDDSTATNPVGTFTSLTRRVTRQEEYPDIVDLMDSAWGFFQQTVQALYNIGQEDHDIGNALIEATTLNTYTQEKQNEIISKLRKI